MQISAVSDYAEQEQQTSPGDEGKTRRLKKKKKKQKKKTHSVDSGVSACLVKISLLEASAVTG